MDLRNGIRIWTQCAEDLPKREMYLEGVKQCIKRNGGCMIGGCEVLVRVPLL